MIHCMRIIYLHQYFCTPTMFGGTRSYEMARRLVAAGHQVCMVTAFTDNNGEKGNSWFTTREAGIEVHWLPVPYDNKMSYGQRLSAFFKFAINSMRKTCSLKGDIVFATSTPLTIAIPGLYASWRNRIPLIFEVRDLWPEAPIQMGALKSPFTIAVAKWLEKTTYKASAHIVALTPGMERGVRESGVHSEKITVIPNGSDLSLFSPQVDGSVVKEDLGIGDRFALVYFGAMGPANGLNFVLDAAAELIRRNENETVFVLHGDGKERDSLEERAQREGLNNLIFSGPVDEKNYVAQLASAADVCMTIYRNLPVLYTCSPNKMFDSFSAGKPVLTNMPGWLQGLVEKNRAGVFVEPDNPVDFADKIVFLKQNPGLCREFGANSRKLAEREFSRDIQAENLLAVIKNVNETFGKNQ